MAEDDIYGSKAKYERFKENLNSLLIPTKNKSWKYHCKNPDNLQYFKGIFIYIEAKDLSFIRRLRIIQTMRLIVSSTSKDLAELTREDVNEIMADMHATYNSPKSKETFIKDIKYIWKMLFPEKDERGRLDETIVPYPVRHLSAKIDKSRQKIRRDKLTQEEFERIVNYFSLDPRIQAYLNLALESLARPQELLYLRIRDVELYDNYAKIYLSEHGKEGVGLLQCIDSFPYLLKWLEFHPLRDDREAFLFINIGQANKFRQLKPPSINKILREACNALKINKPITCYSLKRNGVTIRRLRGESDMEIQHAARWTSTKQLKTYDLSCQDEAFKIALQKRGLIKADNRIKALHTKTCPFCNETIGFSATICPKCKHIIDRDIVLEEQKKDEKIQQLKQTVSGFNNQFKDIKEQIMKELMEQIAQGRNIREGKMFL